jgi:hypothetical protein
LATPLAAFELLRSTGRTCSADPNLSWSPARVRVDTTKLEARDQGLANEAVDAWRSVLGTRLSFTSGLGGVCDLNDGVSSLAFSPTDCQGTPFGPDTLAITVTSWVGDRITDADVSFNPAGNLSDRGFRQVAMHEIGHVIGLDHSDACGESGIGTLMNSRLAQSFDAPQSDDIEGARFIYGGDPGDVGVPNGANGCAVAAPVGSGAWLPLSIGFALWVRGRRRARKSSVDGTLHLF